MLESFSSLSSIFEYLVLGKDTKNTEQVIIKKPFIYGRGT